MKKTIYLFSGEGTHHHETGFRLLKQSPAWPRVETILREELDIDLETIWRREIGSHRCPYSPVLTVAAQICLADLWRTWGYHPDVVVGHSTGELSAAYVAGFYSLEEILRLAYQIGEVASHLEGMMLHGRLSDAEIAHFPFNLSSFNFEDAGGKHVTVCGRSDEMVDFHQQHPEFVPMKLPHPWHHPDYWRFSDHLTRIESQPVADGTFLSGLTTAFETRLADDHWQAWLIKPIDFIQTLRTLESQHGDDHLDVIEIGFHPVLGKCLEIFRDYTHVSSMFRGEDDAQWILHQRKRLDQSAFLAELKRRLETFRPGLDHGASLAYQGFDSLKFTELAVQLQTYFPTLEPQDFYRHKTINQLIDRFGAQTTVDVSTQRDYRRNGVVIAGMSCRFPSAVETPAQFWEMLVGNQDQVRREPGRGGAEAGFLGTALTRFDHQFFNISPAEARAMDPQQILALELTEMLWRDAGIDPHSLDRRRVGVYIGAWSQEYRGDRTSVYYPTGTNPSIIAARISYHYDLRGPSWVSNTACSSSLLAVHYAAKDIEAGRVDYAVAGGVNMLLDEEFTANMRGSGFLSLDNRCKAFDNSANGYVRAEGGGLVLLVNKSLATTYYAELTGSAVNQNGGRSQVITAPHPEAQEELIAAACQDAAIDPREIAYVEAHGTGTKLGDPIEMSAIQHTIARDRKDILYVGSVKSNIGHLESAAGIAGLVKAVAVLNRGLIPPDLHFRQPNQHIDFQSHPIQVVAEATRIDHQANVGISSFGFGGSNAHIIIRGAEAAVRKPIEPMAVPFDRKRGAALAPYLHLLEPDTAAEAAPRPVAEPVLPDVRRTIQTVWFTITGIEELDPNLELFEQGLDSLSATELVRHLEETFHIEIEPDLLFEFPLFDTFAAEIESRIAERYVGGQTTVVNRKVVEDLVNELFFQLTSIREIDPEIELTDQGLDSMSATELISKLESSLRIELEPEILFENPLRDQFVDAVFAIAGRPN